VGEVKAGQPAKIHRPELDPKSVEKRSFAVPKHTTNLRLAGSPNEHMELRREVEDLVDDLCGPHDYDLAAKMFSLLDLLTNENYDELDRSGLARIALHRAFSMTESFEDAVKAAIQKDTPVAVRKASWFYGFGSSAW